MDENTPLLGDAARAGRGRQGGRGGALTDGARPQQASADETPLIADLDERLRRWKATIAERFSRKGKAKASAPPPEPVALISVFKRVQVSGPGYHARSHGRNTKDQDDASKQHVGTSARTFAAREPLIDDVDVQRKIDQVRQAIDQGVYPQRIQVGSSGSYFARRVDNTGKQETVAVFKPADEDPYGNLNPKRVLVRKYFWWMMGRSCLVPSFSAPSEAGAYYLDKCLDLHIVPPTFLVNLSSPSFYYPHAHREAWSRHRKRPPEKMGSFQLFLQGSVNASEFLRRHPWPSRPAHLLEADLAAEQAAHKNSRKVHKAYLRKCLIAVKRFLLCRTAPLPLDGTEEDRAAIRSEVEARAATERQGHTFTWTLATMRAFRIELEKLVILDFLMRNTDRGLDNFMIRTRSNLEDEQSPLMQIGAIDNSLSFPHRHPNGIRDYPFGWLWLPADLIGQPFSAETRNHFLPLLSDPKWWLETVAGLKAVFAQDEQFSAKVFERQMAVMRGQALNVIEALSNANEGPIELCAKPRKLVTEETVLMTRAELQQAAQSAVPGVTVHYEEHVARADHPDGLTSETRDLEAVEERDTSDAEETQGGSTSNAMPIHNGRTNLGQSLPSLSSDVQPRSLPETDSGTRLASLASWQQHLHARRPDNEDDDDEEQEDGVGAEPELELETGALDRSMTGIEVLERELRASRRGLGRRVASESEHPSRSGHHNHGYDEEDFDDGEHVEVLSGNGDVGAGPESNDDAQGGRARPTRLRSNTSGTGGLARYFGTKQQQQQQHVRQAQQPPLTRGRPGASVQASTSRVPKLVRSSSEHIGVALDASVMSLPPTSSHGRAQGQGQGQGQGAAGDDSDETRMGKEASALSSSHVGGGGHPHGRLRPSLRKRMGSVSGWSITSLGSQVLVGEGGMVAGPAASGGGGDAGTMAASGVGDSLSPESKVKVVIQRAVHDPSRAFLQWY